MICKQCGSEIPDNMNVCPTCGYTEEEKQEKKSEEGFVEKIKKLFTEAPDHAGEMDAKDVADNKGVSVLAYLGILMLIPLLAKKESAFARFHVNQGLVLFLAGIVCSACSQINLIGWIFTLVGVVITALCILGIVYAAEGKAKEIPFVNKIQLLK